MERPPCQKQKAHELVALNLTTKLTSRVFAQRGGHGNVHTPKEEVPPGQEGITDKLKNKFLGKKKEHGAE